jgi:glyoxylase-like metal-dependent hydrolase (beta-lactamase superfamily II)
MDQVRIYTHGYLSDLREKIGAHLDAGGDLADAYYVDQSRWARLDTFEDDYIVEMGDMRIEVLHLGPAHSPGDISVWLPEEKLVIAGDMAFHERMLPIFADTCTSCWLETWETEFEPLGAVYVIPGHGHPTNMDQVRIYTHGYLSDLREKIGAHLDAGGDLADAYYVDQSRWARLDTFEELATKNAGRVYEEMEWE